MFPISIGLSALQQDLKLILVNNIGESLQKLKQVFRHHTDIFNQVIQIESRLKQINKQRIKGIITQDDLQRQYNILREDTLTLIDSLSEQDLNPSSKKKSTKRGAILYQIPGMMTLDQATRCVVRLAFEEDYLLERIELTENTKIQSIRIAEVMGVELLSPTTEGAFQINAISSPEQFLDEDDYTEWIFMVKPVRSGIFPLLLKVSVLEEINGKERKREIVLEEKITIVTIPVQPETAFEYGDVGLYVSSGTQNSFSTPIFTNIRRFATVFALLFITSLASFAFDLPQEVRWQIAQIKDDQDGYQSYIDNYGQEGKYIEQAYFKMALASDLRDDFETYLNKFGESGEFTDQVKQKLQLFNTENPIDSMSQSETDLKDEVEEVKKKMVDTKDKVLKVQPEENLSKNKKEITQDLNDHVAKSKTEDILPPAYDNPVQLSDDNVIPSELPEEVKVDIDEGPVLREVAFDISDFSQYHAFIKTLSVEMKNSDPTRQFSGKKSTDMRPQNFKPHLKFKYALNPNGEKDEYQYKVVYILRDGQVLKTDWVGSSDKVKKLTVPFSSKNIYINGDWNQVKSKEVSFIIIDLEYAVFGTLKQDRIKLKSAMDLQRHSSIKILDDKRGEPVHYFIKKYNLNGKLLDRQKGTLHSGQIQIN